MSSILNNINRLQQAHHQDATTLLQKINDELQSHHESNNGFSPSSLGSNNVLVNEVISILRRLKASSSVTDEELLVTIDILGKFSMFPDVREKLNGFKKQMVIADLENEKINSDIVDKTEDKIQNENPVLDLDENKSTDNEASKKIIIDSNSNQVDLKAQLSSFKKESSRTAIYWKIATLVFLITSLLTFFLIYQFSSEYDELVYENNTLNDNNQNLIEENQELNANLEYLTGIIFRIGKTNTNGKTGYDQNYKMFFKIYKPINLKSVYVMANKKGTINISLHTINGILEKQANDVYINNPQEWQLVELDFPIKETGQYYLSFTGDVSLLYNGSDFNYSEYQIRDIVELTGSGKDNQNPRSQSYYQYFYDWYFTLLVD